MVNPLEYKSVNSCEIQISELQEYLAKFMRIWIKENKQLKRSKSLHGKTEIEMTQIQFLMEELNKNLPLLASDEMRMLHEEKLTELNLRKIALEKRLPPVKQDNFENKEKYIASIRQIIRETETDIAAMVKRKEELQSAKSKQ